jgi:RNA-directed DNA polymerase
LPSILLLHLEIQANKEQKFEERMLTYALRIYDFFDQPACSLAILCDSNAEWRPKEHILATPGSRLTFEFTMQQIPVGKYRTGKNTNGEPLGFKTLIKPSQTSISRHQEKLKKIINRHRAATQSQLIDALNPVITGWSNYFSTVVSAKVFSRLDNWLYQKLKNWANRRHPRHGQYWIANRYWLIDRGEGWTFAVVTPNGTQRLARHTHTAIERHVKVQGVRSIFDADWLYWSTRLGRHLQVKRQVALLLKRQKGKCNHCNLFFIAVPLRMR